MKIILTIIAVVSFICSAARAETVRWLVRPEYDHISYYSSDIFICKAKGRLSLIDWNGKSLIDESVAIDSITHYTGGYALVLKREDSGCRILGLLSEEEEHQFVLVSGDYYTTKYSFFSEGFLVVSDKNGKMGYLDVNGQCIINCKYTNARPFRKGYASVNENNRSVLYINHQGKTRNPIGFYGGKIDKGSSFNDDDEAVVRHEKECAIIDREMRVIRKRPYDGVFPIRTYDYAYSEDYINPKPCVNSMPVPDKNYRTFEYMGKYGYRDKWKTVMVPAQFSDAAPICNRRAIASIGDKYGVLELIEGDFSSICSAEQGIVMVYPGLKHKDYEYDLNIPDALVGDGLKLMFDKGDGVMEETEFPVIFQPVTGDNSCVLRARIQSADGLLLWEEEKKLDFAIVHITISNPIAVTPFAMENGIQQIKASITNDTETEVEVESSFTVSLDKTKKNKIENGVTVTTDKLAPGEKKDLVINILVKENELVKAKVSVSVDGFDCGSNSSLVQLKKI